MKKDSCQYTTLLCIKLHLKQLLYKMTNDKMKCMKSGVIKSLNALCSNYLLFSVFWSD